MEKLEAGHTAPPLTANERFLRILFWTSLASVCFFISVVRHNDFGWRVVQFTQVACLLWSWPIFLALAPRWTGTSDTLRIRLALYFPRLWKLTWIALVFGILSAAIDPLMLRFSNLCLDSTRFVTQAQFSGVALPDDHHTAERLAAYREGYTWMRRQTPRTARVVLNPEHFVEVPFFLYANRQAILADMDSSTVFGRRWDTYYTLRDQLRPLFAQKRPMWVDARKILAPLGADYLVLRSDDPAWNQPSDWPEPVYRSRFMEIYALPLMRKQ